MLIYICEESENDTLQLKHFLCTFSQEKRLDLEVIPFSSGKELSADYSQAIRQPDLLFLDIRSDSENGTDTAKALWKMGYMGNVIFTVSSGDTEEPIDNMSPLYYLRRPFDYDHFIDIMEQCSQALQNAGQYFTFVKKKKEIAIPCTDILFFETGQPHTVILHTVSDTVVFRGALSQIADFFCNNNNFLPVGRSFVINLNHVNGRLRNDLIMSDGSIVQIPLRKQKDVLHVVNHWQKRNTYRQ